MVKGECQVSISKYVPVIVFCVDRKRNDSIYKGAWLNAKNAIWTPHLHVFLLKAQFIIQIHQYWRTI